ncbi:hypothetical protein C8J57DRAFT_1647593, partial [Mycena rebaudengoi]
PSPTETLCRNLYKLNRDGPITQVEKLFSKFAQGAGPSAEAIVQEVNKSLVTRSYSMAESPIRAKLYPNSPLLRVCQTETGIGILAGRKELTHFVRYPAKTTEELEERVARTVTAYAGAVHRFWDDHFRKARLSHETSHSPVARSRPQTSYSGNHVAAPATVEGREWFISCYGLSLPYLFTLGHSLIPRIRALFTVRRIGFASLAISARRLNKESPATGHPYFMDALNAPNRAAVKDVLSRANAYQEISRNCQWWVEDVLGFANVIADWRRLLL